jgi:AcrR family transcriptional regulator
LARAAHVSKRTLYQHFASKDDPVAAYVQGLPEAGPTAAEIADARHRVRVVSARSKQDFVDALVRLATEAGAADPDALGHQIALLFDAAQAQGVALDPAAPVTYARSLVRDLIDPALTWSNGDGAC